MFGGKTILGVEMETEDVNRRSAIVTMPPYAGFVDEVLDHTRVSGIRLNTVMPLKESYEDCLKRLKEKTDKYCKDFWVDLKCRQLRVADYGVPPFTEIKLNHEIDVYTPCKAYFSGRDESAMVVGVDGNRLIMQEGPKRVVGPGESITIPHSTLKVNGYLTDTDKKFIEAGEKTGVKYMLSFVEGLGDLECFRKYSDSDVVLKIESEKGLGFVRNSGGYRLMAARGDLYMELHWPHKVLEALENILAKDEDAICASRILEGMANNPEPSCEELGDLDNIMRMGYRNVMFGDEVCLKRDSIISALNVFQAVARRYD